MKVEFTLKLVGNDTLTAVYDTESDWAEFYSELVHLKNLYKDSVYEVKKDTRKERAQGKNSASAVLSKARGASKRPISEAQKSILRKIGYGEDAFSGLTMEAAAPMVAEALKVLGRTEV